MFAVNPYVSGERIYAPGLRNPVGVDWNPITVELWAAVNERDKIGDNLVPDYVTSVKDGGWYGWPYSYYGDIKDPRWANDPHNELVEKAIIPDVPVGAHTASLGLISIMLALRSSFSIPCSPTLLELPTVIYIFLLSGPAIIFLVQ